MNLVRSHLPLFLLSLLALAIASASPARAEVPTLKLGTLSHGEFDLAAKRGKFVVVNYWATWCAPCRKEMPELDALHRERDDVEVIGLAFEEIEPAEMRAFLKERPVGYPIALIDVYSPPAAFDVPRGLPMTYLIGPEGEISKRWLGPVTREDIEQAISAGPAAE